VRAGVKALGLRFPVAVVLPYREFETWFLPCVAQLAGRSLPGPGGIERPGLAEGASYTGNFEYKPTLDQLPLTQLLDLATLRAANVPSFGTFERALRFLAVANPGEVYPPPATLKP